MDDAEVPGPLLIGLMKAQAVDRAVLQHPNLANYARALLEVCGQLGGPVVWPVGASGERLAGAASVLATHGLNVWDRHSRLDRLSVLVVVVSDVTGTALGSAAEQLRQLGAEVIHACGVSVARAEAVEGLASYRKLAPAVGCSTSA